MRRHRLAGDPGEQQVGHHPAHLLDRLVHRGQGGVGVPADRRVVEAHERDVVGHPQPGLAQHAQGAHGHQVGGGEHGIRDAPGGEHLAHRALTAVLAVVAERHDEALGVPSRRAQGVAGAGEPVAPRGHVLRPGEHGDPSATGRRAGGSTAAGAAGAVVGVDDDGRVDAGHRAAAHGGHTAPVEGGDEVVVARAATAAAPRRRAAR